MGESSIIVTASSTLDVGTGPVFKYPFDGDKKLPLSECFERNKVAHFLLVSYCRFNFCQCFANQLLEGAVVLMVQ